MKKNLLIVGAIILLVIAGVIIFLNLPKNELPPSFTINIWLDGTSSGATRLTNYSLVFQNNEIVSGWYKYYVSPDMGNDRTSECTLDLNSLSWIDKNASQSCEINPDMVPLTKEGILQKIISGEFKPIDKCFHLDTCYEVIEG